MTVRFVSTEHAAILRDYLDNEGVILIFPEAQALATQRGLEDGGSPPDGYNFGGSPDVYVDKVASADHFIFDDDDE